MVSETVDQELLWRGHFAQLVIEFVRKVCWLFRCERVLHVERNLFLIVRAQVHPLILILGLAYLFLLLLLNRLLVLVLTFRIYFCLLLWDRIDCQEIIFFFIGPKARSSIKGNTVLGLSEIFLEIVWYFHGYLLADTWELNLIVLGKLIDNSANLSQIIIHFH